MKLIIKKIILIIVDLAKRVLLIENLSKKNLLGECSPLLRFRLFPYSKVTVPYSLGRTVRGVLFDKNSKKDPFARLCFDISQDASEDSISKDLLLVLNKESLMSAADIVNLNSNTKLHSYPAWAIVMPWENISIEDFFDSYPIDLYRNRTSKGLIFKDKSREAIIETMYSHEHITNRINQMKKLYISIKNKGVIEDNNLPKINILIKNNQWRWFMGDGGNHRSYVMSCLNYDFFTARVSQVIYKNDVNNWHNVKNGTYSVDEAKKVFDSYFDGSEVIRGIV